MNTSILLLAAGASTRMGQSKQMLVIDGEPLLLRSAKAALETVSEVYVVLGANAEPHMSLLANLPLHIVLHTEWKKGMGSSLKAGLRKILAADPTLTQILVMLCDQPKVSSSHLRTLLTQAARSEKAIIASRYHQTDGVPALFKQPVFSALLVLGDEAGAAKFIRSHPDQVEVVDFPEGSIDLDTPDDVTRYTWA
jgi:molybdenum cofactor cytidylyltransferase